ncbi:unnamed protein product [Linum tenue]|uniref:Uncharacterized protein n=1 Tax=Linum tenue TaxID=586396 RepID=A0AAV0LXB0_9ROSI|nr:unnamed protein product [Linum tenue]
MFLLVATLFALVSGQEEMAPAPSPSLVTGAAGFSGSVSGAVVVCSLAVSIVGLLKM